MSIDWFRKKRARLWSGPIAFSIALPAIVAACASSPSAVKKASAPSASVSAIASAAPAPVIPSFGPKGIDDALDAAWQKENVTPASAADDATFMRRTYIDVVGTIPLPEDVTAFLADGAPDKRVKLVDRLLASPEYAEHWMNYWDDVLMGQVVRGPVVDRLAFRRWLHGRFAANTPWNKMVYDLVSASGQNSVGGQNARLASAMPITDDTVEATQEEQGINGAVNWSLRFVDTPADLAGTGSRVFLGVQIQCAQCHDHKTEKWKQDDFRKFASAFVHDRIEVMDRGKPMGNIRRVELHDAPKVAQRVAKKPDDKPIAEAHATALDGLDLEQGAGTRKALATWMTADKNPWFAKAIVNRMWGHFMGRGFYDPVDDIRPSNPATMPELLDALAQDFVLHGYDLKYLIREITTTRAYALSALADAKVDPGNHLWAKFRLTPLGPEELLNALFRATEVDRAAEHAGVKNMAQLKLQLVRSYSFLFDVDEDADAQDYSGTVSQALSMLNGNIVGYGAKNIPGTAITDILAASKSDTDAVEAIYLRTLSRMPTPDEAADAVTMVTTATAPAPMVSPDASNRPANLKGAKPTKKNPGNGEVLARMRNGRQGPPADPRHAAFEDLTWALLNSSEFLFNH